MKRLFSIILCLLFVASLAACSDQKETTSANNDNNTTTTIYTPEILESNSTLFGNYYGNSYNNTLLNIGISFPNDWTLSTTAELAETNQMDEQDMLSNFDTIMENTPAAYLLNAKDTQGTNNVNLILENLKISGNENITGAQYIELSKETTKSALQEAGASNIILTPSSVQIGGKAYTVQILSYMFNDTPIYQEQILFPLGNYIGILTLTGDTEAILNRIYTLD